MAGPPPVPAVPPGQKWRSKPERPTAASFSHSADGNVTLRSFVRLDRRLQPDRGPGTPDVTLSPNRRDHVRNAQSLSTSSSSPEQGAAPRFAGLRNFLTKVSPGNNTNEAPPKRAPPRLAQLVMPAARKAALPMLNEDSPPLSPVYDEFSSERELDASSTDPPYASERPHYVAPRHAWSAAQAAADAAAASDPTYHQPPTPIDTLRYTQPLPLPVLNDRASPPSSLSSAPSLTWSSNEDETKPQNQKLQVPAFLSRIYQASAAQIVPDLSTQRADVDPATQPFSLAVLVPHIWKLVLLGLLFVGATAVLGLCLGTLPLHLPTHLAQLTLTEIRDMCSALQEYARSSNGAMWHVWIVLSIFFTWKQAFCVPGSLITNIIFGAMYGAYAGSFFASILTALGGVLCYLLATPFGEVVALVPGIAKPLNSMRKALTTPAPPRTSDTYSVRISMEQRRSHEARRSMDARGSTEQSIAPSGVQRNLWSYLLFLRLLPIVPYGMMNIACGVLRVPLLPYAVTLGVGSVPWNFCTAQIGEILQEVVTAIQANRAHVAASNTMAAGTLEATTAATQGADSFLASGTLSVLLDRIWTVDMMVKLLLLSAASALPIVLHRIFAKENNEEMQMEEGCSDPE